MRKIRIKQVDAFTDVAFCGNPAGVVTEADDLTEEQMQKIAKEMNLSETAFVLKPHETTADFKIRFFTPKVEVPICGHATIATYHCLVDEGKVQLKTPKTTVKHELRVGVLPVEIYSKEGKVEKIMMTMEKPIFGEEEFEVDELAPLLSVDKKEIEPKLPIQVMQKQKLLIPVKNLKTMAKLNPDFRAITEFGRKTGITGICVFTRQTIDSKSSFHLRFFAPALGINEDPVTGVANAYLGAYLIKHKAVPIIRPVTSLIGEQGHFVDRPGQVFINVESDVQSVKSVKVGGMAITVLTGEILLDED